MTRDDVRHTFGNRNEIAVSLGWNGDVRGGALVTDTNHHLICAVSEKKTT